MSRLHRKDQCTQTVVYHAWGKGRCPYSQPNLRVMPNIEVQQKIQQKFQWLAVKLKAATTNSLQQYCTNKTNCTLSNNKYALSSPASPQHQQNKLCNNKIHGLL